MCIIKYVIVYIQIHNLKSSVDESLVDKKVKKVDQSLVDEILVIVMVERYFYN